MTTISLRSSTFRVTILSLSLLITTSGKSESLILKDGSNYRNAKIVAIGENSASVLSSTGLENVPLDLIPEDKLNEARKLLSIRNHQNQVLGDQKLAEEQAAKKEEAKQRAREAEIRAKEAEQQRRTKTQDNQSPAKTPDFQLDGRYVWIDAQSSSRSGPKEVTVRRRSGQHDTQSGKVMLLNVKYRLTGINRGIPAQLQVAFFVKSLAGGKPQLLSTHTEEVTLLPTEKSVQIVSEAISNSTKYTTEGITRTQTQSGANPHGWVLQLVQGGRVILTKESVAGLYESMRN